MDSRRYGIWVLALAGLAAPSWAQQRDMTVPPVEYHMAFAPYYEGDYRRALEAFQSAMRGGIRSTDDALTMVAAGANRIGASASIAIVEGFKAIN